MGAAARAGASCSYLAHNGVGGNCNVAICVNRVNRGRNIAHPAGDSNTAAGVNAAADIAHRTQDDDIFRGSYAAAKRKLAFTFDDEAPIAVDGVGRTLVNRDGTVA